MNFHVDIYMNICIHLYINQLSKCLSLFSQQHFIGTYFLVSGQRQLPTLNLLWLFEYHIQSKTFASSNHRKIFNAFSSIVLNIKTSWIWTWNETTIMNWKKLSPSGVLPTESSKHWFKYSQMPSKLSTCVLSTQKKFHIRANFYPVSDEI